MSSTRLPGKVLRPILGREMVLRQLERIARAKEIDRVIVATSAREDDEPIALACRSVGVVCFRGSLADVLDRFFQAAREYPAQHVMRLTADCPLVDPVLLDQLVRLHVSGGYDYSSNVHPRSYPIGLDAEIFTAKLLQEAAGKANTPYEREHVTPYMFQAGSQTVQGALIDAQDRSSLRWTVDYLEDFEFVKAVYERLYPLNPDFTTADIYELLARQPDIAALNAQCSKR